MEICTAAQICLLLETQLITLTENINYLDPKCNSVNRYKQPLSQNCIFFIFRIYPKLPFLWWVTSWYTGWGNNTLGEAIIDNDLNNKLCNKQVKFVEFPLKDLLFIYLLFTI